MTGYISKKAIYQHHQIALKFVLDIPEDEHMPLRDYDAVLAALKEDTGAKVQEFSGSVKNFDFKYPLSVGLFVEVPVQGNTGKTIGFRIVMLEHESGPEIFIPITQAAAIAAGAWIGAKVGNKVFDVLLDEALSKLREFLTKRWRALCPRKYDIDHVEIRTEAKGVMRLPFSQFQVSQLTCLVNRFSSISHLSDCNEECFSGALVTPPGRDIDWSTESRKAGKPPPLQSCD